MTSRDYAARSHFEYVASKYRPLPLCDTRLLPFVFSLTHVIASGFVKTPKFTCQKPLSARLRQCLHDVVSASSHFHVAPKESVLVPIQKCPLPL